MKGLLAKLERKLRPFAVPHVTVGLIVAQVAVYVLSLARPEIIENAALLRGRVLEGEVWRLVTFLALPPLSMHPVFMFFFWYLFYLMGTALEQGWGALRYNLFLLIGYLATVAAALALPEGAGGGALRSNAFLQGSVFLAFAFLNPDFELYLFFILPVKIKWLALLTWLWYGWSLLYDPWPQKLLVLAAVCNFLVFFGKDIVWKLRAGRKRMARQAERISRREEPFHRCLVCGITDKTHPHMDFRYCTQCEGTCGYCTEHIRSHEHVKAAQPARK